MAANRDVRQRHANGQIPDPIEGVMNASRSDAGMARVDESKPSASVADLVICVSGIYAAL
jgi:hypothetical protein